MHIETHEVIHRVSDMLAHWVHPTMAGLLIVWVFIGLAHFRMRRRIRWLILSGAAFGGACAFLLLTININWQRWTIPDIMFYFRIAMAFATVFFLAWTVAYLRYIWRHSEHPLIGGRDVADVQGMD